MPIKVLVISNYKDYHSTRPEAEIFIGLARLGFQIYVMSFKDAAFKKEFKSVGIELIDFFPVKKFSRAGIQRIRAELIQRNIQILHLFNGTAIVNGLIAAKGLPVKTVLYRGFTGHVHWYDPSAYLKYLHPRVDKIMCNSQGVAESINKQLFFNKSKTVTVYKGHNIIWYEQYEPKSIRKELGISADSFVLVNVANRRKMKGIAYLLEAFNALPGNLNIHLLLVGKDMDNAENMEIINAGDKKEQIHLLGYRKDVLHFLTDCNGFILSSIKGEGMTKALLEAMALGIAPIITDLPGNNELVVHKECGLIVPVKDPQSMAKAIIELYNNRDLCQVYGQKAQERIKMHFNVEQSIHKLKSIYEDLVIEHT